MAQSAARVSRHSTPSASASPGKQRATHSQRAPSELALRSSPSARVIPFVQTKLEVNHPGDRFERHADAVAHRVTHISFDLDEDEKKKQQIASAQNPRALQREACAECAQNPRELQREAASPSTPTVSPRTAATIRSPGAGQPLSLAMRSRIEPQLGADLSSVRLHSDPAANQAAVSLHAHAFTHQNHIFLRSSAQSSSLRLMAHEATHVVQQGAAPIQREAADEKKPDVQRAAADEKKPDVQREAIDQKKPDVQRAAVDEKKPDVQREAADEKKPPEVQRSWLDGLASAAGAAWDATGGTLVNAAGEVVSMGADFFWAALRTVAPEFVPILEQIQQQGILGYLGDILRTTFSSLFDGLVGQPGAFDQLVGVFTDLAGRASAILTALASGDCQPLFAAVNQMKTMLEQVASDVWGGITDFFRPIGDFFSDLWQKFGAPVINWLTSVAGDVWQRIQNLGSQIWAWTQPLRDNLSAAWDWVKTQLFGSAPAGGGAAGASGGESSGGLVGWVTDMVGQAWDGLKRELDPVIAPIQSFAQSVVALLPMDRIRRMRDSVTGFLGNVQNMTQNLAQPQDAVQNQGSLREAILPAVLSAIGGVRDAIIGAGGWVAGQVGGLVASVNGMLNSLRSNSLLSAVAGAISWVQDGITQLSTWAQTTVVGLFASLGDGLVSLSHFIEPVLNALQELVALAGDLVGRIGGFISGIWNRIPACIREPIQQFITEQILSRIPIFGQLMQIPGIWTRVSETVMRILRQVFVSGDLLGAAWTFFRSLLEVLGIPPELVLNIISKAAAAITDILNDPVGFFLNLLSAVKQGFIQFFDNIGTHLLNGVTGWLFSELSDAGIHPPADISLRSIVGFVFQVLGITVDNFFERLGEKIGAEKAQRIRRIFNVAVGAIRWVYRLVTEGPGAIWEELQGQLSNLWSMVLDAVIGWLQKTIIKKAMIKLLSMLDPTGIMAVVNSLIALYKAIQSFARYIRPILETVNTVLDGIGGIAHGALDAAAGFMESGLARILPIAIGFLANQVGLEGLGERIGEMVETAREYVNKGIDWLIDKGIEAFNALLGRGESAADDSAEKSFSMESASHTLTATMHNDQLKIVMASSHTPTELELALQNAIATVQGQADKAPAGLLVQLQAIQSALSESEAGIEQDWKAAEAKNPAGKGTLSLKDYAVARLTRLTQLLFELAKQYHVQDLLSFFSTVPKQRFLPAGYDVRAKLYERGSDWTATGGRIVTQRLSSLRADLIRAKASNNQSLWNTAVAAHLIPDGFNLQSFNPNWVADGTIEYHLDHKKPLSDHWSNRGGNNDPKDETRRNETVREDNLQVVTKQYNLSKGSLTEDEERARYTGWVGPEFASEYAQGNVPNAKNIDGQPFLHAKNGPPIV